MTSIHREPDDIFAAPNHEEEEEEEEETESGDTTTIENQEDHGSELTAAAALTSLVVSQRRPALTSATHEEEDDEEDDDDEEEEEGDYRRGDMELEIPQRFTKSGRKRAVSFPLKVRALATASVRTIPNLCLNPHGHSILTPFLICCFVYSVAQGPVNKEARRGDRMDSVWQGL